MASVIKPRDAKDVEAAVQWALGESKTLEIVGQGSKRAIGRAAQWDLSLDLSNLSGVTLYEPDELVLSAKAGTPIAEIEAELAKNTQGLALEPYIYRPGSPATPGRGTNTGLIPADQSGPVLPNARTAAPEFF